MTPQNTVVDTELIREDKENSSLVNGFIKYASEARRRINQGTYIQIDGFLPMYDYRLDTNVDSNLMRQWKRGKITRVDANGVPIPRTPSGTNDPNQDTVERSPINVNSLADFMCFPNHSVHDVWSWSQVYKMEVRGNQADTVFVDLKGLIRFCHQIAAIPLCKPI